MPRRSSALILVLLLCGCASAPLKPSADDHTLGGAVTSPLRDVNLVRSKIPDALLDAIDAPYARPRPLTCLEIIAEITPLDEALGADLDKPATSADAGLLQRGATLVRGASVDAVRGAMEGLIPHRGWVRRLTGAEQQDRLVLAAITSGAVRRAYLKGLGLAQHCPAPAEPSQSAQYAVPGAQRLQRAADAEAAAKR